MNRGFQRRRRRDWIPYRDPYADIVEPFGRVWDSAESVALAYFLEDVIQEAEKFLALRDRSGVLSPRVLASRLVCQAPVLLRRYERQITLWGERIDLGAMLGPDGRLNRDAAIPRGVAALTQAWHETRWINPVSASRVFWFLHPGNVKRKREVMAFATTGQAMSKPPPAIVQFGLVLEAATLAAAAVLFGCPLDSEVGFKTRDAFPRMGATPDAVVPGHLDSVAPRLPFHVPGGGVAEAKTPPKRVPTGTPRPEYRDQMQHQMLMCERAVAYFVESQIERCHGKRVRDVLAGWHAEMPGYAASAEGLPAGVLVVSHDCADLTCGGMVARPDCAYQVVAVDLSDLCQAPFDARRVETEVFRCARALPGRVTVVPWVMRALYISPYLFSPDRAETMCRLLKAPIAQIEAARAAGQQ